MFFGKPGKNEEKYLFQLQLLKKKWMQEMQKLSFFNLFIFYVLNTYIFFTAFMLMSV